jgi:NADH-quinone oxidoreductase subunit L
MAGAVVSAIYSAKAVWYVWQPAPAAVAAVDRDPSGRVHGAMLLPLVVLAAFAAALGVLPFVMSGALVVAPAPAPWELLLSAALAAAAALMAWRIGAGIGEAAPLAGWLGLERAAHVTLVRPTRALAEALARFDDQVLDRAVEAAARAVGAAARALDRRGEVSVDGAVRGLAAGARALGRLARRPQTGQLHQYFAQAAVAFAVLALLVIVVR